MSRRPPDHQAKTAALLLALFVSGNAEAEPAVDAKELPRIAPKEPAEALATFTIAPGYRLEQVAAEPLVIDPIAMGV